MGLFPEPTACRLIVDPPSTGVWNMAVDEALLQAARRASRVAWRFYQWTPATLSLGFFQRVEERQTHPASAAAPLVRRASGGGAIIHDRELTYSLVVPLDHARDRLRLDLYRLVHETLIQSLGQFGVHAELWEAGSPARGCGCGSTDDAGKPFLCFQRFTPGDVVMRSSGVMHKVGGSAQRRDRHAVLQHGSVLLQRSDAAPELPGIVDLSGRAITIEDLSQRWLGCLESRLSVAFEPETLDDADRAAAEEIARVKYASDAWTVHKGRKS